MAFQKQCFHQKNQQKRQFFHEKKRGSKRFQFTCIGEVNFVNFNRGFGTITHDGVAVPYSKVAQEVPFNLVDFVDEQGMVFFECSLSFLVWGNLPNEFFYSFCSFFWCFYRKKIKN